MDYDWLTDAAERVLWTLIQVALASAIVWLGDFDGVWVVPLATLLAGIKTAVAKQVGDTPNAAITFTSRTPPA